MWGWRMRGRGAGLTWPRMAHRTTAPERQTYLVEHYRAGVPVDELRGSVSRVRDTVALMQREGAQVGFLSSTIVPWDEYFLCVVDAISEEQVRAAFARAGIPFERISPAISVDGQADEVALADHVNTQRRLAQGR
jgi:hypothetical protein